MEPYQYKKRILLAITGLSPQVVTETLYALAIKQQPAFVPTEIHVMTTAEGFEHASLTLLSQRPGWFHRLCSDYGLPPIAFDESHIHVLEDREGIVLQDIRTPEENSQVADQISELVRNLAADEDSAIHASIAGGRKTMGFYLGYALSLYGRPQDRLSHVLVESGFESNRKFYYPTPYSKVITELGNKDRPMDTSRARVTLADIPFVRLRDGLPQALLDGASSFSDTIEAAQRMYGPVSLKLDLYQGKLTCGGMTLELTHADMAFYAFMVERAIDGKSAIRWSDEGWRDDYLATYAKLVSTASGTYMQAEKALSGADDGKDYFEQRKSRTNGTLKKKLGSKAAEPYLVHAQGSRPHTRFGLTVTADAIKITNEKN